MPFSLPGVTFQHPENDNDEHRELAAVFQDLDESPAAEPIRGPLGDPFQLVEERPKARIMGEHLFVGRWFFSLSDH